MNSGQRKFCCLLLLAVSCSVQSFPFGKMLIFSADPDPKSETPTTQTVELPTPNYHFTRDEHMRRTEIRDDDENETALIHEPISPPMSEADVVGLVDRVVMPIQIPHVVLPIQPPYVEPHNVSHRNESSHSSSSKPEVPPPSDHKGTPSPHGAPAASLRTDSALLTNHGGKILPTVVTKNIFWGTSWAGYSGDKMYGMDKLCRGLSGSDYIDSAYEYTGTNGVIGTTVTHQGYVVDTSAASGGGNIGAVFMEVCKMIPNPDPSGNGFYAVFTDIPRGTNNYCAYHSYGTCSGVRIQFGFFWNLDGDAGCNPRSTVPGQSEGLAAIANVYAHELMESKTDPNINTWLDASGQENGDKCAWTFANPYVTLSDGGQWKLQTEWSNNAYITSTGVANYAGQKGCIDHYPY